MTDLKDRRHEVARREIIDAAWAQAEKVGIAAMSLRDLGRAVGMRAPSLYTYFASKDAIYDAMFTEGYRALDTRMKALVEESAAKDRVDALTMVVEEFVAFCQASPVRYALMFTRAVPGWEPSEDAYSASIESFEFSARALAEMGIDTEVTRDLYVSIVAGLAAQQMANEPEGDRWRRLARPAMEMLVEYLDRSKGTA